MGFKFNFNINYIGISIIPAIIVYLVSKQLKFQDKELYLSTLMTFMIVYVSLDNLEKENKQEKKEKTEKTEKTNKNQKEGYENMKNRKKQLLQSSNNDYHQTTGGFLLVDDQYPLRNPIKKSNHSYQSMSLKYVPKTHFPAKSFKTNNIRYWASPDNGTCTFPELCDAIYQEITPEQEKELNVPGWNDNRVRVNFYNSL